MIFFSYIIVEWVCPSDLPMWLSSLWATTEPSVCTSSIEHSEAQITISQGRSSLQRKSCSCTIALYLLHLTLTHLQRRPGDRAHMLPSADVIWNGPNTEPWGTSGIISVWMYAAYPLMPSFTSFLYSFSQWTTLVAFGSGAVVTYSLHIDATTSGNGRCPKQLGVEGG